MNMFTLRDFFFFKEMFLQKSKNIPVSVFINKLLSISESCLFAVICNNLQGISIYECSTLIIF